MNSYRTWAEIDLGALKKNYDYAVKKTGGKPVMPVIKGDAHGHGAPVLGKCLEAMGAAAFAVATLPEAVALRKAGITKPVLILGFTDPSDAKELLKYDITQSAYGLPYACELNAALKGCRRKLSVHVKIDTGMARTGINARRDPGKGAEEVMQIAALPNLSVTGIFTHYAAADMPEKEDFTAMQLENFKKTLAALRALSFDFTHVTVHASNSAVIMYHPESHFDMVRMGVMMYGMYPSDSYPARGELTPVLTLKSRVAQVKEIEKGTCVSYGCTYCAPEDMKIAVVAAGYADSYPRALSGKGAWAVIGGKKCPQIGRICMDMCMFDVTDTDVKAGDEVILYGQGGMSHEEIARLAGSINCEHTCLLPERVKKVYIVTND